MLLGRSVGLDIGSHSIKVVEIHQYPRRVEVTRVQSLRRPSDLGTLLTQLSDAGLEGAKIVGAIPGDRLTRRTLRFPFRDRKRLEQAVPFEIENETPFDLEDVWVDYEVSAGEGQGARVAASVVRRRDVETLLQTLRDADISLRVLDAEGLVLANLHAMLPEVGRRLLVDMGHQKTTLCLVEEGYPVAARVIPFGGAQLIEAIAAESGTGAVRAEESLVMEGIFGDGITPRSRRVGDVLERWSQAWARAMTGFEEVLGGPVEERLDGQTLVGGCARIARIDRYFEDRLGIPCSRIEIAPQGELSELLAAGDPGLLAPALALAMRGTSRARTRSNFLRDEWRPRVDLGPMARNFRPTMRLAAAALVLALLSVVGRYAIAGYRADALETRLAEMWQSSSPDAPIPESVPTALGTALRDARERADQLGLYGGNLSALDLLVEISKQVPGDLSLVFEELSIDGQVVRIRGHTPSFAAVDQLQSALGNDPNFGEIRVSEIQADAKRGGNNFSLTVGLNTGRSGR